MDLEVFGGIRHGYYLQKLCEILEMMGGLEKKRGREEKIGVILEFQDSWKVLFK